MTMGKAKVRQVLDAFKASGRNALTTPEGKRVCDTYGLAVQRPKCKRCLAMNPARRDENRKFLLNSTRPARHAGNPSLRT